MIDILNKFGSIFSPEFIILVLFVGLVLLIWDRKVLYRKKRRIEHRVSIILGIVYVSVSVTLFVLGRFIN